jgi:hypothetical protein
MMSLFPHLPRVKSIVYVVLLHLELLGFILGCYASLFNPLTPSVSTTAPFNTLYALFLFFPVDSFHRMALLYFVDEPLWLSLSLACLSLPCLTA